MKSKRDIKKQQTRERILESAVTLYSDQGFVNTSMDQIACRAQVAKGSLFVHFSSQNQLISTVIQSICSDFGNTLYLQMQNFNGNIQDMLQLHLDLLKKHENLYRHLIIERTMLSEDARQILITMQSAISNYICLVAEREMQRNNIKIMPPHLFFNTWIALLHYYLINYDLFQPTQSVIQTYQHELLTHFSRLIEKNQEI